MKQTLSVTLFRCYLALAMAGWALLFFHVSGFDGRMPHEELLVVGLCSLVLGFPSSLPTILAVDILGPNTPVYAAAVFFFVWLLSVATAVMVHRKRRRR